MRVLAAIPQNLLREKANEKPRSVVSIEMVCDGVERFKELLNSLKTQKSFIVVDPDLYYEDEEYGKPFYFQKQTFDVSLEKTGEQGYGKREIYRLNVEGVRNLYQIAVMFAHIGIIGGDGHSFSIESTTKVNCGFDGDGADKIVSIKINGEKKDLSFIVNPKNRKTIMEMLDKGELK